MQAKSDTNTNTTTTPYYKTTSTNTRTTSCRIQYGNRYMNSSVWNGREDQRPCRDDAKRVYVGFFAASVARRACRAAGFSSLRVDPIFIVHQLHADSEELDTVYVFNHTAKVWLCGVFEYNIDNVTTFYESLKDLLSKLLY